MLARIAAFCLLLLASSGALAQQEFFDTFVKQAWPDARAKGITRATFDAAMHGVTPDQRVITATQRQPEYGKPVGDYINGVVSKDVSRAARRRSANGARLSTRSNSAFRSSAGS